MTTDIELINMTTFVQQVAVYDGGTSVCYGEGDIKFDKICSCWRGMLTGAHRMPAYAVSLNKETCAAMQKGLWVEFVFNGRYSCDGMPFEKLLVSVAPQNTGFNVMRYNAGVGYDGRCFYFDLVDHDMSDFYNCIKE